MKRIFLIAFLSLSGVIDKLDAQLLINEFMASNESTYADELGEFDDWVEVYNPTANAIDMSGYFWSDSAESGPTFQLGDDASYIVPAGAYLVFWFDKDLDQGMLHVDLKLSGDGEEIVLYNSDQNVIDSYSFGGQFTNVSEGRSPNGGPNFDFFVVPTPNAINDTEPGSPKADTPTLNLMGGLYDETQTVSMTVTDGSNIRYTMDGSIPTETDILYAVPLIFNESTTLRVRAFKEDLIPSDLVTETYLIDIDHIYPIVALTVDPEEMYGENGIYENFLDDIEIESNIEFFEPDGTLGFGQVVEIEIAGTASASFPQKSLTVKAKGSLGDATMSHQIFPNSDIDQYRSLVIRNSGNDWPSTFFRDAMIVSLQDDLSDMPGLVDIPKLHDLNFRPIIMYVNGMYDGIYNLRERADSRYLKTHFNLNDDEVDFLELQNTVREGDLVAWDSLYTQLENTDYSSDENFATLAEQVDINNYLDYLVFQIYIDNTDWPGNNERRFREREQGARWRYLLYDLDFSFGFNTVTGGWNTAYAGENSLNRMITASGFEYPNPGWGGILFQNLIENQKFRQEFINRHADWLNTIFKPQRVANRIDQFLELYEPEKDQHNALWLNLFNQVEDADTLKKFVADRPEFIHQHYLEAFDEATALCQVTINISPQTGGTIEYNTLNFSQDYIPWTGTYYQGVPVPISAYAKPGFEFSHWQTSEGQIMEANTQLNLNGSEFELTAVFTQGSTQQGDVIINEINYNSSAEFDTKDWVEIFNRETQPIDIGGWYIQDEENNFYNIPLGTTLGSGAYLVLSEDLDSFQVFYPSVVNAIGSFNDPKFLEPLKFSNSGELIGLYNASGQVINQVDYLDVTPWPIEPDGTGFTLQLRTVNDNNGLPQNWAGWESTPGMINNPLETQYLISSEITIFPNPTSQILLIHSTSNQDLHGQYQIINSLGHAIQKGDIELNTNQIHQINLFNFPVGFYSIQLLIDQNTSINKSFIIQK